jgi:hypothetical protein
MIDIGSPVNAEGKQTLKRAKDFNSLPIYRRLAGLQDKTVIR